MGDVMEPRVAEHEAIWRIGDEFTAKRWSKDAGFETPPAPEGCRWKYLGLRYENLAFGRFILVPVETQNG